LSDLSEDEQKKLASGIIAERVNGGHADAEQIFGDVYELLDKSPECKDANEFATLLNACGKMGRGYLGLELCLNVAKAFLEVKWINDKYRKALGAGLRWLYEQIEKQNTDVVRKTKNAMYVLAGKMIDEHIISNAISIVEKSTSTRKPFFAFADSEDGVKVSARAPEKLVEEGLNLKMICKKAAEAAGGHGGGHSGAAGAHIPAGSEENFIRTAEEMLSAPTHKSTKEEKNIKPEQQPNNSYREDEDGRGKEESRQEDGGKKVEGQGLVQYIGS
ncbi:MAG: hypothetical protein JSV63_00245, partial [Candidatus Aenigmatarchaeota archaeon]